MKDRTKLALVIVVCAMLVAVAGCTTTSKTVVSGNSLPPAQTTVIHEVREDGTVIEHETVGDIMLPDSPSQPVPVTTTSRTSPSWLCKVAPVLHAGFMIYSNPELAAVYVASAME